MIYDEFKSKLINDMETERDILVVKNRKNKLESLFGIKDESDKLYMNILNMFENIAIRNVENLVCALCRKKGITCRMSASAKNPFDIEIDINQGTQYVEFKNQPNVIHSSAEYAWANRVKECGKPINIVFLLKEGYESRERVFRFENSMLNNTGGIIKCYLFEEFLEKIFGEEEKKAFQATMVNFKNEMHKAIGYQITELCSPYNLEKLKEQLDIELLNYNYDHVKDKRFVKMRNYRRNVHDLNNNNYNIIKNVFLNNGRYKLLLGNSDFAESFITSEWLYKKYFLLEELDNTFIVSGYLKSIEQLLWDIIFIVGQGRKINKKVISETNEEGIGMMLGSLQDFLGHCENDDLFQNSFETGKRFVIKYLETQISDWRKQYRNGYFHKCNLNDKGKIETIREETYFLYLLILGTINLTPADLYRIS